MIKDFNNFKNKNLKPPIRSIKEEYYYASNDNISWWRVLENSYNDEVTITRSKTKSSNIYDSLIAEIQSYMRNRVRVTGYNGLSNGEWDDLTSECIMNWKKRFDYDWVSGNSGDVICKSFYKTIVYSSMDEVTLLDRCIQDVTQRPGILQEAWKKAGNSELNNWANEYAKRWINNMKLFVDLIEEDWSFVNTFKDYKNKEVLKLIYPSQVDDLYKILGGSEITGDVEKKRYIKILYVLNKIRKNDVEAMKLLKKG